MTSFTKACIDLTNNLRNFRFNKSPTIVGHDETVKEQSKNSENKFSPELSRKFKVVKLSLSPTLKRKNKTHTQEEKKPCEPNVKTPNNTNGHIITVQKHSASWDTNGFDKHPTLTDSHSTQNHSSNEALNEPDQHSTPSTDERKEKAHFRLTRQASHATNRAENGLPRLSTVVPLSPILGSKLAAFARCSPNGVENWTNNSIEHINKHIYSYSNNSSPIFPHRGMSVAAIKQRLLNHGMQIEIKKSTRLNTRLRDHFRRIVRGRVLTVNNLWQSEKLLTGIFRYLSGEDLLKMCTICRRWLSVVYKHGFWDQVELAIDLRKLESRICVKSVRYVDEVAQRLESELIQRYCCGIRRRLSTLSIKHSTDNHAIHLLNAIRNYHRLRRPSDFECFNDDNKQLEKYSSLTLPNAKRFSVATTLSITSPNGMHIGDQNMFDPLHDKRDSVLVLKLRFCAITDHTLEQLIRLFPDLRSLELQSCNALSDCALWVGLTPNIVALSIYDCINVADESISAIAQLLPNLERFSLQAYHVTDTALGYFTSRQKKSIHTVRLIQCMELTNQGFINLAFALSATRHLSVSGCTNFSDEGLELVCENMKELYSLDLSWCSKISDTGMSFISNGLNKLKELRLDRCGLLTDEGLANLSTMFHLCLLSIRWCMNLSDVSVSHLLGMTGITHLSMAGCRRITCEGFCKLARHPRLCRLEVTHCPGANSEVKRYLREILPDLRIKD